IAEGRRSYDAALAAQILSPQRETPELIILFPLTVAYAITAHKSQEDPQRHEHLSSITSTTGEGT
ncbi:hypothetical protein E4U59_006669, partial [Claviceps monticola]